MLQFSLEENDDAPRLNEIEQRMNAAVEHLRKILKSLRNGKASPSLLDHIKADVYNQQVPLEHLASISLSQGNAFRIRPYHPPDVGAINKAILKSDLGLSTNIVNKMIVVQVPPIDDEQRTKFSKRATKLAEEQRIAIRNIRKDARNAAKRAGELKQISAEIDKLTQEKLALVESLLKAKLEAINWKDPDWN